MSHILCRPHASHIHSWQMFLAIAAKTVAYNLCNLGDIWKLTVWIWEIAVSVTYLHLQNGTNTNHVQFAAKVQWIKNFWSPVAENQGQPIIYWQSCNWILSVCIAKWKTCAPFSAICTKQFSQTDKNCKIMHFRRQNVFNVTWIIGRRSFRP